MRAGLSTREAAGVLGMPRRLSAMSTARHTDNLPTLLLRANRYRWSIHGSTRHSDGCSLLILPADKAVGRAGLEPATRPDLPASSMSFDADHRPSIRGEWRLRRRQVRPPF